ncbi:MAG: hypothetical protein Q4C88_09325 [Akkermansia sp.]|nr:hypothetical protein [Akkermansia sp.]
MTTGPVAQDEYTWNATSTPAYWDEEATNWTLRDVESKYTSGVNTIVNFKDGDFAKEVTVVGAIEAGTVNVNANYEFTVGSGDSLSIDKLSVAADKEATVAGAGSVTLTKVILANGATINMGAAISTVVAVADDADNTAIKATKDITLTSLAGPAEGKELTISAEGHTVAVQGNNTFAGDLVVAKGTVKLDSSAHSLGAYNGKNNKQQPAEAPDKTITVNEGGTIDLNGKADQTYIYTLAGGSLVNNGGNISNGSMQTIGIELEANSTIGGTGNFYLLGPGYDNTFVTLNEHKLTKTGANSVGFRNTNVSAGTIEVKQGNIEFIDGDNSSLAANIILDGGTISGTVRANGEISVTAQQETTLNGLTVRTGQVDIAGTVNVSGGSLDLSNGNQSTGTIRVSNDGVLNVASTLWLCSNSKIEVEGSGDLNIAGLSITAPGGVATLSSNGNLAYGTGNENFTIANADITATANVTIGNVLTNVGVYTGAHAVTLNATADSVTVAEHGTINFGTSGATGAITVKDGGIIGTYAKSDTGATTITSEGTAVLKNAIALNAGSLTMTGTYSIDDLDGEIEVTDYVHGEHADNGFAVETGTIEFVTVAPESEAVLVTTGAQIMRGGNAATVVGGVATVDSTNYATFHITNLSETVTQAKSQEASSGVTLTSIHVDAGAELTVDQNIDLSLVSAEAGAKLNILSGKTVSVGDATTTATIAGAGTYALKSGSKTMTGTLATGEDWKGTVVVSSVGSFVDINLNTFGHEGSKVKFDGVTGHFGPHIITYAPELVLGEGGLTLNNGYSTDGQGGPDTVYTFAGGVSGTGNMTFNRTTGSTVRQQLVFSGDVSEWTGTLSVVARFNVTAHYIGVDKTVNSTISRTGGDLHVKVGTGEDASVVTFAQGITANDLAVLAGATAIVNGGLTANTITVDERGSLTMNGGTLATAITSSGSVTLTGVTLDSTVFTEQTGIDAGISKYDITGALVPDAVNYYAGTKTYLEVVSVGGSGSNLTWGTRTDLSMVDGRVITGEGARIADTFYVTADTVLYSDLIAGTENVEVSGGKFQIDREASNINIHVSGDGVIAGYVEPEQVKEAKIEQGATATFEGVTTLDPGETNTHVTITSDTSEKVAITNVGETDEAISYEGLGQAAAKVTADAVEVQAEREADVTIANALEVQSITNNSEHTLYLDGEVVTEALNAAAGDITLHNVAESVELGSLSIGDNVAVGAYQGTDEEALQEATVVISQTLTAGEESVLHANLELKDGATLNFTGTLTMTSDLDVQGTLALDESSALYQELASFAAGSGRWVDLIMAADGSNLAYINPGLHGVNAAEVFTNDLFRVNNDYMVFATEDSFGITRVPEPTTGTLSLLALAALAARRRKH